MGKGNGGGSMAGGGDDPLIERNMEIKNKLGLHARAAAKLVHVAARFKSDIKVRKGDEEVDGKSILGILLLAAGRGSVITVRAGGPDEAEALDAVQDLIDRKFDEVE
ncbi:MAG: Phosphotransferase system, phosphocarrier protein HPr [Acidobacteria bacterium]|nr:Phosphotransferase system, phosphocarrier protein HPr [Acidobacteriota bacterium]